MREKGLLYFALGVTSVLSLGAAFNQVLGAPAAGLAVSDTGITFPDGTVQTTAASADPRRVFYLTNSQHLGNAALTACATGFHMASLWEILDVSNLRYARNREVSGSDVYRLADSGVGPPSDTYGWIRTGWFSSNSVSEGVGNCSVWTSAEQLHSGTVVELELLWASATGTGNPAVVIAPWDSLTTSCSNDIRVWCFQD